VRYLQSVIAGEHIVADTHRKTLVVAPDSELATLIAEAGTTGAPLIVESGEQAFRLDVRPLRSTAEADPQDRDPAPASLGPAELYRALSEGGDIRQVLRTLAVDAELRGVAERFESSLRAEHPELFDRRGHLRVAALRHLLKEQAGNRSSLSGVELRTLEEEADAADRAPSAGAS
jgi:hypothetical protein